ncbi:hypothetical protein Tco_1523437 [Tanacetum coccineum]
MEVGKVCEGNTIVHPPVSLDEHVSVQRENKVRTLLLQALPEDHMPYFHHNDDARDIWVAVKARFGGNEESKKMRKTMLKQQFTEFSVTEEEGLHKGYDRVDQLEIEELDLKWQMAMLSLRINRFEKKAGRKMDYNNKQTCRFEQEELRCYKCLRRVYGMMAGLHVDNGGAGVSDAAAEFAMMGISPKIPSYNDCYIKTLPGISDAVKTLESHKDWTLVVVDKPFTSWFCHGWGDACSHSLHHWNLFAHPIQVMGIDVTPVMTSLPDSETYASCDSSLKTKTKDFPPAIDIKTLPESNVEDPNSTAGNPKVYMFVDKFYPIRATLLERMLRHRLTVPPSYCRDIVVAGSVIQTIQAGLRESYECLASCLHCTTNGFQLTMAIVEQKKLMQTQEDHSNPIPALNVDSLKVDLVVKQNTCSEKEDSNSETASSKSAKECSLNSTTKDVHAIKYKMSKAKERCMAYFRSLHSHLQVLSKGDLKGTHGETWIQTGNSITDKMNFKEDGFRIFSETAFWVVNNQFQKFINSKFTLDYDSQMTDTYFVEYTGIKNTSSRQVHDKKGEFKRKMRRKRVRLKRVKHWMLILVDTEKALGTDITMQNDSSRVPLCMVNKWAKISEYGLRTRMIISENIGQSGFTDGCTVNDVCSQIVRPRNLNVKRPFEQNSSSLEPQCHQKFIKLMLTVEVALCCQCGGLALVSWLGHRVVSGEVVCGLACRSCNRVFYQVYGASSCVMNLLLLCGVGLGPGLFSVAYCSVWACVGVPYHLVGDAGGVEYGVPLGVRSAV